MFVNEANGEGGVQTGWRSVNVGRSGEINRREGITVRS